MSEQVIYESTHFYVLHDGFPLTEGHLLVIPKDHYNTYSEIKGEMRKEYEDLEQKIVAFLSAHYVKPIIFEHGKAGQTVHHAHMHFLPTSVSIYNQIKREYKETSGPQEFYLYYKENNKSHYFAADQDTRPGYLHTYLFAKSLRRPTVGPERGKDLSGWLLRVKNFWKLNG